MNTRRKSHDQQLVLQEWSMNLTKASLRVVGAKVDRKTIGLHYLSTNADTVRARKQVSVSYSGRKPDEQCHHYKDYDHMAQHTLKY